MAADYQSQLPLLVVPIIHADLYLKCLGDLLHDGRIGNMPTLLQKVFLVNGLHLFSQGQTVFIQSTAFGMNT